MKKFSNFLESCVTSDVNPGNALSNTGIANHYTPVQNILTNIKNLYCTQLGIVASIGEDGVSIKLNCSKFINKEEINKILYRTMYNSQSLYNYIYSQGLSGVKVIDLGQYSVVYFYPTDLAQATPGLEADVQALPCKEMLEMKVYESEMYSIITEDDDDEELEDLTKKQLNELIDSKDKVKAAKQFGLVVANQMELPNDYYFAGVKSKDGEESIALRWKYIKRRPHGKSTETTRSLINIFGTGKDGIWVGDFDKDCMFQLPDEVKKLIENILDLLEAEKTNDPCVYEIKGDKSKDDDKKDDDKKDDDKKDDKKDDTSKKSDEDDNEDDDSRGDKSDDINDLLK